MNLLVDFILRHPWAAWLLGAFADFAIWTRPYLSGVLWFLGVFYGSFAFLSLLAAWWSGFCVCGGALAASWWCIRRMDAAALELERLRDRLRAGESA